MTTLKLGSGSNSSYCIIELKTILPGYYKKEYKNEKYSRKQRIFIPSDAQYAKAIYRKNIMPKSVEINKC